MENLKPYLNQRVMITKTSGAKYLGKLVKVQDKRICLNELCIINRAGAGIMSGENESRWFDREKVALLELA